MQITEPPIQAHLGFFDPVFIGDRLFGDFVNGHDEMEFAAEGIGGVRSDHPAAAARVFVAPVKLPDILIVAVVGTQHQIITSFDAAAIGVAGARDFADRG